MMILFAMYAAIAGVAFDWCLWSIFGKDIPAWADVLCGIVAGEVAVPLAVVVLVVSLFIHTPLFP